MTMQSAVKAISFGFAAMLLATAGAARADEGDSVPYTGDNTAQVDAAEAGGPDSVLNKDQANTANTAIAQAEAAEAGAPASILNKDQPIRVASAGAVYQTQVRAAEAGNPHSVDSGR
jgi:hypothetical protein